MSASVKSLRLKRALKIGQITKKSSLFKKFYTPPLNNKKIKESKTIMYDAIYFVVAFVEFLRENKSRQKEPEFI